MIVIKTKAELSAYISSEKNQQKKIGFVPTMGALHKGHISLIEKAKHECDIVVCSIFVNPTQFNDPSDLEKYPRTVEKDCAMLEAAGCNIVFIPEVMEIYTLKDLVLKKQNVEDDSWKEGKTVDFGVLAKVMEGAHRPGHFNGVAQVVSKLFRIVNPDKAYFGQKDFQQLAIIRSMVKQLEMPIEIVSCPIVREDNGLAMSSRNERLSAEERDKASTISKTLFTIKQEFEKGKGILELKELALKCLQQEPLIVPEYFEISDSYTLEPAGASSNNHSLVACVAVKLGPVRLIDNILLK